MKIITETDVCAIKQDILYSMFGFEPGKTWTNECFDCCESAHGMVSQTMDELTISKLKKIFGKVTSAVNEFADNKPWWDDIIGKLQHAESLISA